MYKKMISCALLFTVVSAQVGAAAEPDFTPIQEEMLALSEETHLICKDYDAAALRLRVVATQPTRLNDGA